MVTAKHVGADLTQLLDLAEAMASDLGGTVAEIIREGLEQPLDEREAVALLDQVIRVMRAGAEQRGDAQTIAILDRDAEALMARAEAMKTQLEAHGLPREGGDGVKPESAPNGVERLQLQAYDGIQPQAVKPSPVFHERPVAVVEGFVRTRDIRLWDENERLDIHLNQFQQKYGRRPNPDELLTIMQGELALPGIEGTDQFEIRALAKSIAVNGVRKPPIIDTDGTLLDGNRRVTACYYILNRAEQEFTSDERKRAEWLKVWQLTEHATDQEREAVIVSLNFEPDFKQDWPEYVKAQKVYEDYETRVTLEPRANPTAARLTEIKRDIARKFALSMNEVTRYINMVKIAREFEEYHVVDRSKDQFATKHRAADKFQYFDELNKGKGAGGVNWSLNQDESFKHLVFDLLFDNKFTNWRQIRDLKYVAQNEDALQVLRKARDEGDVEVAQEGVDDAIGVARSARAEQRQTGVNPRIRTFTEWFLNLPVKVFDPTEPGAVKEENLRGLADALKLVERYLDPAVTEAGDDAG
jgi:predicted DNA-binding protein